MLGRANPLAPPIVLGLEGETMVGHVLFGAACSLAVDGLVAVDLLAAWEAGRSGLRGTALLAA